MSCHYQGWLVWKLNGKLGDTMMNNILAEDTAPSHSAARMLKRIMHELPGPTCPWEQSGFLQIRKRRNFQAVQEDTLEKGTTGIARYRGEEKRENVFRIEPECSEGEQGSDRGMQGLLCSGHLQQIWQGTLHRAGMPRTGGARASAQTKSCTPKPIQGKCTVSSLKKVCCLYSL